MVKRTRYRCWDKKDGSDEVCENDSSCPASGCNEQQEEECNTEPCKLECIWTEWGEWGGCTPNCATGNSSQNDFFTRVPDKH